MTGKLKNLIRDLGEPVESPEEETFDLFSQSLPSQNLGFVDSKAQVLDLTIGGRDLTIHQSPTVLSSNRAGGTTGAVVWKITPLFASWISSSASDANNNNNPLFASSILSPSSQVVELGCGISALVGLLLAPKIRRYVLTDQAYVSRLVQQNIAENHRSGGARAASSDSHPDGKKAKSKKHHHHNHHTATGKGTGGTASHAGGGGGGGGGGGELLFSPLDWETDTATLALGGGRSFDAVIAADCIYNDALIQPLVDTCADICRLRHAESERKHEREHNRHDDDHKNDGDGDDDTAGGKREPTVCVIAQQLRDDSVFEGWITAFCEQFTVWRVPEGLLPEGLKHNSGFVVHLGVLKEDYKQVLKQ